MFEKTLGAVPPHIVWIIADDLGTFDVPFTNSGSEVLTPTLSRLAAGGLVLDQYCVCPSRTRIAGVPCSSISSIDRVSPSQMCSRFAHLLVQHS